MHRTSLRAITVCLNACFMSDHQTLQSIQGLTCHGGINYDIAVGLFTDLLTYEGIVLHTSRILVFVSRGDRKTSTRPLDLGPII